MVALVNLTRLTMVQDANDTILSLHVDSNESKEVQYFIIQNVCMQNVHEYKAHKV